MIESILTWITPQVITWTGGSIVAFILAWILKKIPNNKIKLIVGEIFFKLGCISTLGLSRWKYSKGLWNKIIKLWIIDLIDNIIGEAVKEFIRGLKSDNEGGIE